MTPHRCPVCTGQGRVSRPPWLPGDMTTWGSADTRSYECHACDGTGIVWASEGNETP